jgi:hypothetical protein
MTVINMIRAKMAFISTPHSRHFLYYIVRFASYKKIHEKGYEVVFQLKLHRAVWYPTGVPVIFLPNNIFMSV